MTYICHVQLKENIIYELLILRLIKGIMKPEFSFHSFDKITILHLSNTDFLESVSTEASNADKNFVRQQICYTN